MGTSPPFQSVSSSELAAANSPNSGFVECDVNPSLNSSVDAFEKHLADLQTWLHGNSLFPEHRTHCPRRRRGITVEREASSEYARSAVDRCLFVLEIDVLKDDTQVEAVSIMGHVSRATSNRVWQSRVHLNGVEGLVHVPFVLRSLLHD